MPSSRWRRQRSPRTTEREYYNKRAQEPLLNRPDRRRQPQPEECCSAETHRLSFWSFSAPKRIHLSDSQNRLGGIGAIVVDVLASSRSVERHHAGIVAIKPVGVGWSAHPAIFD